MDKKHNLKICLEVIKLALDRGKNVEDDIQQEILEVSNKYGLEFSNVENKKDNLILADMVSKKVPTFRREEEYKRITLWIIPLFILMFVASIIGDFIFRPIPETVKQQEIVTMTKSELLESSDNYYNQTQDLYSALEGNGVYVNPETKTTVFEKEGCIYAIGNLTPKEKEAEMLIYKERQEKEENLIDKQLQREHELKLEHLRSLTEGQPKKLISRPIIVHKVDEIKEEVIEEEIVPIEEIEIVEQPTQVEAEEVIIETSEPQNDKPDTPPGQENNENSNKPETPPGQDSDNKPENPGQGKGKDKK